MADTSHYVPVAERKLNPADFPGVDPANLVSGSAVFSAPEHPVSLHDPLQWWKYVQGACWNHPFGLQSDIRNIENMSVVQVCFEDAAAYTKWAGKRLPTEAEREYAARGGKPAAIYYWKMNGIQMVKWCQVIIRIISPAIMKERMVIKAWLP